MSFNEFMSIFANNDIDQTKAASAYIKHLLKDIKTRELEDDFFIYDNSYRKLLWEVGEYILDLRYFSWLIKTKIEDEVLSINLIISQNNIPLTQKLIRALPVDKHINVVNETLQLNKINPKIWQTIWEEVKLKKTSLWYAVADATLISISTQKDIIRVFELLQKRLGRNYIKTFLNESIILHNIAQYSDINAFEWIWKRTLRKPFFVKQFNSKTDLSILGYALINESESDILEFLLNETYHPSKELFANNWYHPNALKIAYENMFANEKLSFQDKFLRFRALYQYLEGSKNPCFKLCNENHIILDKMAKYRHLLPDRILLCPMETTEQLEQCLGWLKSINAIIYFDTAHNIRTMLSHMPRLLSQAIDLVDKRIRPKFITWALVYPFLGCTQHPQFQELSSIYQPTRSWWKGIIRPLKSCSHCAICRQTVESCFDHRMSWWMGAGFNIDGITLETNPLAMTIILKMPKNIQNRFVLMGVNIALAHQLADVNQYIKEYKEPIPRSLVMRRNDLPNDSPIKLLPKSMQHSAIKFQDVFSELFQYVEQKLA
tara:strand:+ start:4642 stop:6282 length:1641 start_codon:yes stop_codon:yes gene_type:complete